MPALARHPRNLTDEMIRALAERGGVAGINYYAPFLKDADKKCRCMDSAATWWLI